jgi:hypothetical protein
MDDVQLSLTETKVKANIVWNVAPCVRGVLVMDSSYKKTALDLR